MNKGFIRLISVAFVICSLLLSGEVAPSETKQDAVVALGDEGWKKDLTAPPELKAALSQGKLEFISVESAPDIAVRVFGKKGKRTPAINAADWANQPEWLCRPWDIITGVFFPLSPKTRMNISTESVPGIISIFVFESADFKSGVAAMFFSKAS